MTQFAAPSFRVAAYIRVSTDDQAKGGGPDQQRDAITAWARDQGAEIVSWHEDHGTSGEVSPFQRQRVLEAIQSAKKHEAKGLVVAVADRWTRGGLQDGVLSRAQLAKDEGLALYISDMPAGVDGLINDIILAVRDAMAAEWLRVHKERVRRGAMRAKDLGWPNGRPGRPPKPELQPKELDAAISMLESGRGFTAIALQIARMRGLDEAVKPETRRRIMVSENWVRNKLMTLAEENPRLSKALARRKTLRHRNKQRSADVPEGS